MNHVKKTPRAFTLIELLVVISIVAMLIALLLPALAKSREVSRITVCATNMRSIGQASALYQNDYKSFMPIWMQDATGFGIGWGWDMNLAFYLNSARTVNPGWLPASSAINVFQCPDAKSLRYDAFNRVSQDYAMAVVGPFQYQVLGLRVKTDGALWSGNAAIPSFVTPTRKLAVADNFDVPGTLFLTEYDYMDMNLAQGAGKAVQRPFAQMDGSNPNNFTPQLHGGKLLTNHLFADGRVIFAKYNDARLVGPAGSDTFPQGAWTVLPND